MCRFTLCLLIASLMLSGCGSLKAPLIPQTPQYAQLDSKLAQPCPAIPAPTADDFDAWQDAYQALAAQYAKCAIDKAAIIKAWSREQPASAR